MLDALLALANTKGGASFLGNAGAGLFQPDNSPVLSGQVQFDSRAFLDGAGWTVSTGKGSATGATVSRTGEPMTSSSIAMPPSVTQAGTGWMLGLAMVGIAVAMILKRG